MARLKVFTTRIGFFEALVAAPSRKAALAAWDTKQNLFAQGAAGETHDATAREAALVKPGVVVRRPVEGPEDFTAASRTAAEREPARRPAADRGPLTRAEKALEKLQRTYQAQRDKLDRRAARLAAETAALEQARAKAVGEADDRIARARAAYRRARG